MNQHLYNKNADFISKICSCDYVAGQYHYQARSKTLDIKMQNKWKYGEKQFWIQDESWLRHKRSTLQCVQYLIFCSSLIIIFLNLFRYNIYIFPFTKFFNMNLCKAHNTVSFKKKIEGSRCVS